MTTTETETLFRKVGRKYVPAYSMSEWSYDKDLMPVGRASCLAGTDCSTPHTPARNAGLSFLETLCSSAAFAAE